MSDKIEKAMGILHEQPGISWADVESILHDPTFIPAHVRVCHRLARNAGWWQDLNTGKPIARDMGEVFTLIHSEITEGFEGWRKDLMDDKLPHRPMIEVELADTLIRIYDACGGFEWDTPPGVCGWPHPDTNSIGCVIADIHEQISHAWRRWKREEGNSTTISYELGGAVAYIHQLAEVLHLDVQGAVIEKLAFNTTRADHKRENRLAAGGKKC